MAWKIDYQQDTELKGVGTAVASYTDDVDPNIHFTFAQRLDTNDGASIESFIGTAKEIWVKKKDEATEKNAIVAKIEAVLNEALK